jgi:glucose-6-phosphate 1-dehydrogenase
VIEHLAILGGSGDLTGRYLLPALARLAEHRLLPPGFRVTGLARSDWDDEAFRGWAADWLERQAGDIAAQARTWLCGRLSYRQAEADEVAVLHALLAADQEPVAAYLALPPAAFGPAVDALGAAGLAPGSCIVVEKPFGGDLASAQDLNARLHRSFREEHVFRVDHFLGLQAVQNVLALRFANRIFEPLWSAEHVRRVEIRFDETLGLEGRAGYYDTAGALRDMVQNHLLQVLCLVAMEQPTMREADDLRDRKVDVLHAVRRLSRDEIVTGSVRGRYTAGDVGGRRLPAYTDEPGVDPSRETETFAELTLWIDNPRWSGVPFVLRTGKALDADLQCVDLEFAPVPLSGFGASSTPPPNRLRMRIDPERIALRAVVTGAGGPFDLDEIEFDADLAPAELPPYARVLLDVLRGDRTLSIRADEAEEAWRIVEPVLDAWHHGAVPLDEYPAGSFGPDRGNSRSRRPGPA